jgi:photosystem II stability/assembly factor-like uncharacterized protein
VKNLHKAFVRSILAVLFFLLFAFSWTDNYAQAAAFSADGQIQLPQATEEYKLYLPIISKAPSTPVPIGPVGGSITSVLVDPVDQNMVYAGSFGGGVLKTVDGGNNWFKSGTGMPGNAAIQSLGLIPSARNIVFAGTNGDGLYRSSDYGGSWTKVGQAFGTNAVYGITPDPNRPNVVYIVSRITTKECNSLRGAFYRSEDYGITWSLLRYGDIEGTCADYWYDVDVNPWDSNIVYLSYHQHGPYRSTDYASSFVPLRNGIDVLETRSIAIDTLSNRMYSGYWDPTYVFFSDNLGEQWSRLNFTGSGVLKISLGPLYPSHQRILLSTFKSGVVFSNDRGGSWITRTFQNPQNIVYDIAVSNTDPQHWYAGTQFTGLFISTNYGASWFQAGTGIVASSISGLTTSSQLPGETIAAVYGQGIMTTSDDGANWKELNNGLDSTNVTSVYDLGGQLFASADTGLYLFDGTTWLNLNMPRVDSPDLEAYLDYNSETFLVDKPLAEAMLMSNQKSLPSLQKSGVLPGNTPVTRLALSNDRLYAGTAGDGLWVQDGTDWQAAGFEGDRISDLEFSQDGSLGILAACTQTEQCSVYTNSGSAWMEISSGLDGQEITDLLISPEGKYFAVASDGIYGFEQISGKWRRIFEADSVLTCLYSNLEGNTLVALGEGAAWYSLNHGESWQIIDGLDKSLTYTSALISDDGSLILGSNIGGAFKVDLPKP